MAEPINLEDLRSSSAESGFLGVKVTTSGKFQAQIFIKADNRQRGLGTFDTAEEAAVMLAIIKREMKASTGGKLFAPPKINKPHKPRARPAVPNPASPMPVLPPQLPVATAVALPTAFLMPNLPFAVASPIPMPPLGDA